MHINDNKTETLSDQKKKKMRPYLCINSLLYFHGKALKGNEYNLYMENLFGNGDRC